jgi:hypothetical protein
MKRISISILTMAAFGAMAIGAHTAAAEGWISTGWQPLGTFSHLGNGGTQYEGFSASYAVSNPDAPPGVTVSGNNTGTIFVPGATNSFCQGTQQCPTLHWAFTLCKNNTFLTGSWAVAYSGSVQSSTSTTNGAPGSGYWNPGWSQAGTDTGYCPSSQPMTMGGMWMYQF